MIQHKSSGAPFLKHCGGTGLVRLRTLTAWLCVIFAAALAGPALAQENAIAKIEQVTSANDDARREFYGRVVALETIDLAFQVGGQIIQFPVVEGSSIDQGTLIATLDPVQFELALAQATAQFDQASRTLERFEALSGNTVSQASIDDAQTNFDLAKVQVDQAQRALDQAMLSAPFDALVSSRLVANQSSVGAGTPVVRLHNMSEIRIEISVPEVLFQRAGRDPDVTLTARFPASEDRFEVGVREYNAETAAVGQTYTITLGMTPPDDLIILPGSSVVVEAHFNALEQIIGVPRSALIFAPDGTPHVMLFEESSEATGTGTVIATPIEIAPNDAGDVIVVSGLEAGQEYVAAGASKLQDGQTVTRFTGFGE